MQKYHIKSEFPALVECQNQCFELSTSNYIVADENEKIKVYPVTTHRDCYNLCYMLSLSEQNLSEYKKIKFPTYIEIYLKEKLIARSSVPLLEKKESQVMCSLSSYPHTFFVETQDGIFQYQIPYKLVSSEIKIETNCVKLIAFTDNKDYLLAFNRKKCNFFEVLAEKIEIKDNIIKIKEIKHNIAKHAIEREINQDDFTEIKRTLFYVNKKPKIVTSEKLIPFAFLEATQVQDFNLAKNYLGDSLKSKLSDKHLECFFGEINKITTYKNYFAVVDFNNNAKLFDFNIKNKKIENITEVN